MTNREIVSFIMVELRPVIGLVGLFAMFWSNNHFFHMCFAYIFGVHNFLDDALKGELKTKSRFLHRMLPVLATCRADMDKINDGIAKALEVYMASQEDSQSDITYKAEVKVRNNNDKELSRNNIISAIGSVVKEHYPEWKVDLSEPKVLIMIDILKKVCCISVVKDYSRYKKFNLQELAADFHTEKTLSAGDGRVKAANPKTDNERTDDSKTNSAPDKVAEIRVQNDIPMTDSNLDQKQDSGPKAVTESKSVESEDGESDSKRRRLTAEPVSEEGKYQSPKGESNQEVNNRGIPAENKAILNTAGDS